MHRHVSHLRDVLQVANSWRTTAGLSDTGEPASWDSIIRGLDNNAGLGRFAGPGGWNNMDFLQVSALNISVQRCIRLAPQMPTIMSRLHQSLETHLHNDGQCDRPSRLSYWSRDLAHGTCVFALHDKLSSFKRCSHCWQHEDGISGTYHGASRAEQAPKGVPLHMMVLRGVLAADWGAPERGADHGRDPVPLCLVGHCEVSPVHLHRPQVRPAPSLSLPAYSCCLTRGAWKLHIRLMPEIS